MVGYKISGLIWQNGSMTTILDFRILIFRRLLPRITRMARIGEKTKDSFPSHPCHPCNPWFNSLVCGFAALSPYVFALKIPFRIELLSCVGFTRFWHRLAQVVKGCTAYVPPLYRLYRILGKFFIFRRVVQVMKLSEMGPEFAYLCGLFKAFYAYLRLFTPIYASWGTFYFSRHAWTRKNTLRVAGFGGK